MSKSKYKMFLTTISDWLLDRDHIWIYDKLYDVISKLKDIRYWFLYRFYKDHQYHIIRLKGVKPGYRDTDYRIEEAICQLLIDYVEIELSHMYKICHESQNITDAMIKVDPSKYGLLYIDLDIEEQEKRKLETGYVDLIHDSKELKRLYLWAASGSWREFDCWDEAEHAEKTKNLMKIVEMRRMYWT